MNYIQQKAIIRNINRQKIKVNNSKKYSESDKTLIIKGLEMAINRAWTISNEKRYRIETGLPLWEDRNIKWLE